VSSRPTSFYSRLVLIGFVVDQVALEQVFLRVFLFTLSVSFQQCFIFMALFVQSKYLTRRLRWAGHMARKGETSGAYRALLGIPEGRRPPERPRRRWEDNIKMDLREVG
jgi:hypothetical protein